MAQRALTHAIGDALIDLFDWAWPHALSRVDEVLEKVADVVRPDPPMTLRTLDGQILTGLLVLDRGQALLFLGVREHSPAIVTPPPTRHPFVDDGELWPGAVDPYRRR